jgi:hypothetical protein
MQNNNNTTEKIEPLPTDGEEIVTLPRLELDALISRAASSAAEKAISDAVKQFEDLFAKAMGNNTAATDVVLGKKWLETSKAAPELGKRPAQLREMVNDGRLRLGKEVRDDRPRNAINPVYVFNIPKCEQRLLTPPEKRGDK